MLDKNKLSLGIFCGPGAFRGMYHNGFLQAMKENGIQIDKLLGSSAGFCAITAHVCDIEDTREFWLGPDAPIHKAKWHRYHFFDTFIDHYIDKMFNESPHTEQDIIKVLNKKCGAVCTKLNIFQQDIITNFRDVKDVKDVQRATASMPFFLSSFPNKVRKTRYIDGGFTNKNPFDYLDTDIKVVLQTLSNDSNPKFLIKKNMFNFKLNFPGNIKNAAWGNFSDYRKMFNLGMSDGFRFVEQFNINKILKPL